MSDIPIRKMPPDYRISICSTAKAVSSQKNKAGGLCAGNKFVVGLKLLACFRTGYTK
jgi:hypothetical protein